MSSSAMSSLSRAFTTRRNRGGDGGLIASLQRSPTKASPAVGGTRYKISAPVELISTTNMLSYNAPDIQAQSRSRSPSLESESDGSARSPASASTAGTTPDTSSIESSPTSPKPNHLSCYFGAPSGASGTSEEPPKIPQRVPSHTKKSAEALARKRSISRASSLHNSISSGRSSLSVRDARDTREARDSRDAKVETALSHPFGLELAQVSELAEEFGLPAQKLGLTDPEEDEIRSRGLLKFSAQDYISEIGSLYQAAFGDAKSSKRSMWI